jgi:D-lactate dehydrogenase
MSGMKALGAEHVPFQHLLAESDIISFHVPLTEETYHMINTESAKHIKQGATIINTSRGEVIDASALVPLLKTGHLGGLGLDVYEHENQIIWKRHHGKCIQDDTYARLQGMPNVILTGQQGWFTHPAIEKISEITISNLDVLAENPSACPNLRHYVPKTIYDPTTAMH